MRSDVLLVVDLETTGLEPATAGIVEVAFVAVHPDRLGSEFSSLLWPGREKLGPAGRRVLEDVSRITLGELLDAPDPPFAYHKWCEWTRANLGQPPYAVTSYNVAFDSSFLLGTPWAKALRWQACVMEACCDLMGRAGILAPRRNGDGWQWPRLSRACDHFEIPCTERHRALEDCRSTARLVQRLRAVGVPLLLEDLPHNREGVPFVDDAPIG